MAEKRMKHLEFIQGVINRMGYNSFMIKGWAVTLIAGIFVLSGKDNNPKFITLAFVPLILFWGLDAYFLHQEKLFRALYNDVRQRNEEEIDFSMETAAYKNEVESIWRTATRRTLGAFWGSLFACLVVVTVILVG